MNSENRYQPDTQFSIFPPAIKHLLIINGLFFVAQNTPFLGNFIMQYFALWPLESGNFYPWQLVGYMFLHGGFTHILFNMFALWLFGQAIERAWGTNRFLLFYFVTGVGAAVLQMFVSSNVVIGASGAVYGILLAFGMMFPNQYIYLLIPPIPIKAKYFVIFYGALELVSGLSGVNSGVAHFAHLGGMLIGFLLIMYWKKTGTLKS